MDAAKISTVGLVVGFILSLSIGLLLASAYASFHGGIGTDAVSRFDIFAFWYETPFYAGFASDVFYTGLAIIAVCVAALMLAYVGARLGKTNHHGTARWATLAEIRRAGHLKRYSGINGPIFGKTTGPRWFGRYLTSGDKPHSLIVAPTRAGKGVGVVIPTLLTCRGSVLALDVKGELFELTSRARKTRGDTIYKFAPLDPGARTHSYNPVLDIVETPPERRFVEARRLAVSLIVPKNKGAEGFIDGARDLFVAGIFACIERGTPTIGAVYDLFSQPGEKYKLFAQLAEECTTLEARRIFDNMASNDTKILTSYTSVLGDSGLNLWADPLIKAATTTSDFSIQDLRRTATTIYLCVSPNDLEVISPLIRLFFQQAVSVLQRTMPGKDEPHGVLFLLDEFKHLGKLEAIETAVTTIAGYGGRFMFIIQSLSSLTANYDEAGKQNFLGNTGVQVFMATSDDETPVYISKAIGEQSFRARSTSYSQNRRFDVTTQFSEQGAPLLRPEQVRLMDEKHQVVFIKGQPPLRMPKVEYYRDNILRRIFEAQKGALPEPPALPAASPAAPPATVANAAKGTATAANSSGIAADDDAAMQVGSGGMQRPHNARADAGAIPMASGPEPSVADPDALAAQNLILDRIIELQRRSRRQDHVADVEYR